MADSIIPLQKYTLHGVQKALDAGLPMRFKTNRQERMFVLEFVHTYDMVASYKRAYGKKADKLTDYQARQKAYKLLSQSNVDELFHWVNESQLHSKQFKSKRLIDTLTEMMDFDPAQLFDENNDPIPLKELPTYVTKNIQYFEAIKRRDGSIGYRYKLVERVKAMKLLADAVGLTEAALKAAAPKFILSLSDGSTIEHKSDKNTVALERI